MAIKYLCDFCDKDVMAEFNLRKITVERAPDQEPKSWDACQRCADRFSTNFTNKANTRVEEGVVT